MEAVATQAVLPGGIRQRQDLLDLGKGVVEGRVEAGDLEDVRAFAKQNSDGFEGEWLVQRRQRDIAPEIAQHVVVDHRRGEVLAAAMHHAMGDGDDAVSPHARCHLFANHLQGGTVRIFGIEFDGEWRDAGFAEIRLSAADALHFSVPERRARQRIDIGVEHRELDTRRAAVQDQDEVVGRRAGHGEGSEG